jgi:hypothetical protein
MKAGGRPREWKAPADRRHGPAHPCRYRNFGVLFIRRTSYLRLRISQASCGWFAGLPSIDSFSVCAVGLSQAEGFCKVQLSYCEILLQKPPPRLGTAIGRGRPVQVGRTRRVTERARNRETPTLGHSGNTRPDCCNGFIGADSIAIAGRDSNNRPRRSRFDRAAARSYKSNGFGVTERPDPEPRLPPRPSPALCPIQPSSPSSPSA